MCAALALTTVLGAACGTSSANQHGTALLAQGAVATGRFGFNSYTTGQVYGFALPLVRNASHETVVIQSVAVLSIPRFVQVLGYRQLSAKDTHGQILGAMMSGRHSRFDYDSYPSYGEHLRLPPESASDHYYVVYVRFTGQPATNMSECQFEYTAASRHYRQTLHCEYNLTPH